MRNDHAACGWDADTTQQVDCFSILYWVNLREFTLFLCALSCMFIILLGKVHFRKDQELSPRVLQMRTYGAL